MLTTLTPNRKSLLQRPLWLLIITLLLLTGCGFRLQGTGGSSTLPPQLHVLYFTSSLPYYHSLTRRLKNTLKRMDVKLVANPKQAPFTLAIVNIKEDTRQVTNSVSSISTRSYLLTSYLTFTITRPDGRIVIQPTTISASRHFVLPGNVLLENSDEQTIAQQELQQTLIELLFDRLSSNQVKAKLAAELATAHTATVTTAQHENRHSTA